jgi:hypothetical protein
MRAMQLVCSSVAAANDIASAAPNAPAARNACVTLGIAAPHQGCCHRARQHKIARMAWAMMARGERYREPVALAAIAPDIRRDVMLGGRTARNAAPVDPADQDNPIWAIASSNARF